MQQLQEFDCVVSEDRSFSTLKSQQIKQSAALHLFTVCEANHTEGATTYAGTKGPVCHAYHGPTMQAHHAGANDKFGRLHCVKTGSNKIIWAWQL